MNGSFDVSGFAAVSVPEPGVVLLLVAGMLGMVRVARQREVPVLLRD